MSPHARFPWGPVQAVGGLWLAHLALVFRLGRDTGAAIYARAGGLLTERAGEQPWRLVTSLFVHADPAHVFWNGISMMVFAVPLIQRIGYLATVGIYLLSGIGGGLAALTTGVPGQVVIGSSGAVSGLFGAWLALTLRLARHSGLPGRARIRVIGVSFLMLPTLLSPTTAAGDPVSIESHLGGLAVGMATGFVAGLLTPPPPPVDDDDGDPVDDETTARKPATADR